MEKEEEKKTIFKTMIFCCRIEIGSTHHPRQAIDSASHSSSRMKRGGHFGCFSRQVLEVMREIRKKTVFFFSFSNFMERMRCCKIGVP
jgi:hypothetical protein